VVEARWSFANGKTRIDTKKSDPMCEIGKESFTTSCCRPVKRLILTFTVNIGRITKQSRENDQNWSIGEASLSITTMPHTFLATHQKLKKLDWEILMHPPYSPNLAPLDYHFYRTLYEIDFKRLVKITRRGFSPRNHSSIMTWLWFYLKNGRRSNKTTYI